MHANAVMSHSRSVSKAWNAFRSRLARHPQGWAVAAGALLALGTLALGLGSLAMHTLISHDTAHTEKVAFPFDLLRDTEDVRQQLRTAFTPGCDEDTLKRLRLLAFSTSHIKDIGVLREGDDALVCTTVGGVLDKPAPYNPPQLVWEHDGRHIALRTNVKLVVSHRSITSMILREGPFNMVIDPMTMQRIAALGFDVVRAFDNHGHWTDLHRNPALSPAANRFLDDPALWPRQVTGFDWRQWAFYSNHPLADSSYVLQSYTPLLAVLRNSSELLAALGLTALALALLGYGAARPVLARWGQLKVRLPHLLETPGSVVCLYQPIIDLRTGRVAGCEVLMRLRDGGALLTPDRFIPTVEALGLQWEMDRQVLAVGLGELSRHLPQHQPPERRIKVAFNLFPLSLKADRVHQAVGLHLDSARLPGLVIEFEIIEHHYRDALLGEVLRLKELGYLVAVDDFGTGYSNLASVHQLAPHFLKIDRSFLTGVDEDTLQASLLPEIVAIARATGAAVVAEGVETEAQRKLLRRLDVDYAQGYLFGRPMPITEFAVLLKLDAAGEAEPGNA